MVSVPLGDQGESAEGGRRGFARARRDQEPSFEALPEGDYYVLCHVSWLGEIDGQPTEKTALVAGEVHLPYAQHRNIVLAPDYAAHAPADE